jgi:predicted NBD/HSP70 family sugar kinase
VKGTFNPCLLILGSGVMEGMPTLMDTIEEAVRTRSHRAAANAVQVTRAALGPQAGTVGAAQWARQKITSTSGDGAVVHPYSGSSKEEI